MEIKIDDQSGTYLGVVKRYSTTIYFKVKLSNAQICLQLTQQHYS